MTYAETLDYLYAQLPMFHRIGAAAYKADLNNTWALMDFLNHPEKKIKSIHIAGTNGKGSCSHLLAAIFQKAGYKTGLYTSPHLKDFRERIKINGEMVAAKEVIEFAERTKLVVEKIHPSFFELTVGMCFEYFAKEKVDIAIIETGLGGRLDSTNVILPELSLITNISFDHTNLLGDTLEKIAFEKAGIIKKNVPVVIGETSEVKNVFSAKAVEMQADIVFADEHWNEKNISFTEKYLQVEIFNENKLFKVESELKGIYQLKNAKAVIACCEKMNEQGWNISNEAILEGFKNVKSITKFRGRWDVLSNKPTVVADIAHNEAGITAILEQLKNCSFKKLHIVLGMVKDKDVSKVLSLLPTDAEYYFCAPNLPRALSVDDLATFAKEKNLHGEKFETVIEALEKAKSNASEDDLILITGSNFVVAEVV